MGHYTRLNGHRKRVRRFPAPNGHTAHRDAVHEVLFPSAPVGPHCFLRQGRHDEPFGKRDRDRRKERRFRTEEKLRTVHEGDVRCTHID